MFELETITFVGYGQSHQMRDLYDQYFEVERIKTLSSPGITDKALESGNSIPMTVMNMGVRYLRPVDHDDTILIKTIIRNKSLRSITFHGELFNECEQFINKEVTLAVVGLGD